MHQTGYIGGRRSARYVTPGSDLRKKGEGAGENQGKDNRKGMEKNIKEKSCIIRIHTYWYIISIYPSCNKSITEERGRMQGAYTTLPVPPPVDPLAVWPVAGRCILYVPDVQ